MYEEWLPNIQYDEMRKYCSSIFLFFFCSPPPPQSHTHLFKVYTQAYGLLFVHIFMLMTTGTRPLYAFAVQYHVYYCTYMYTVHEYSSQILSPWLEDIVDYSIGLSYRHIRQLYALSGTKNLSTEHIPTKISKTPIRKFSKQKFLFFPGGGGGGESFTSVLVYFTTKGIPKSSVIMVLRIQQILFSGIVQTMSICYYEDLQHWCFVYF